MRVWIVGLAGAATVGATAAAGDAEFIQRIFHDLGLIVAGLKDLIEPIIGLIIAISVGMQYVIMRNQKRSSVERKEQTEILKDQNKVMEQVSTNVDTVKSIQINTAMNTPNKEETP